MSQKKLVKLIYYINQEESTVSFDPNNRLSILKKLINLTQRIDLDNYDIFYVKKKISWDEDKILKEIIGMNSVPVFYLKKKEYSQQLQNQKTISNISSSNTIYNKNSIQFNVSDQANNNTIKCKVSIDFFPSRAEIYTMLDNFLSNNNYNRDYESNNKGTGVEITFNNSVNIK